MIRLSNVGPQTLHIRLFFLPPSLIGSINHRIFLLTNRQVVLMGLICCCTLTKGPNWHSFLVSLPTIPFTWLAVVQEVKSSMKMICLEIRECQCQLCQTKYIIILCLCLWTLKLLCHSNPCIVRHNIRYSTSKFQMHPIRIYTGYLFQSLWKMDFGTKIMQIGATVLKIWVIKGWKILAKTCRKTPF